MNESAEDQLLRTYDHLVYYEFNEQTLDDIKAYAAAYSRFVLNLVSEDLARDGHALAAAAVKTKAEGKAP